MTWQCRTAAIALALATACSARSSSPGVLQLANGGGAVIARVGTADIPVTLVERTSAARAIEPREALGLLVQDALLAQGAAARGLDHTAAVEWQLIASRAAFVATALHADAVAAGPPSDADVADLSEIHWREVALPDQVRVIHAIVLRPKPEAGAPPAGSPADVASRGRAIAEAIAKAVTAAEGDRRSGANEPNSPDTPQAAASADEFERRANAVAHDGFDVKVERLPLFVADGRISEPGRNDVMDATFAAAACALTTPGATSRVVETSFGWHVIRLVARVPGHEVPLPERRAMFREETITARGRHERDAILSAAAAGTRIELSTAAEELMAAPSAGRGTNDVLPAP